jgi:hypothetical protein
MIIEDKLYGTIDIDSPVMIDLINSAPVQRLKGIIQSGVPEKYNRRSFSRFEHSLGVMFCLKFVGASEEEQIAGLLHDVSHTAFSHTIDWVLETSNNETFQDDNHEDYIENSVIPSILEKYGYSSNRIVDYKNFPLLEQDIPNLCADRLDYSIKEFPYKIAKECLLNLTVKEDLLVFKNEESAFLFADNFLDIQNNLFGGKDSVVKDIIFVDILKKAFEKGAISMEDFWRDDNFVLEKVEKLEDPFIQKRIKILLDKDFNSFELSDKVIYKKFRYVDPFFISGAVLKRLSSKNNKFRKKLEESMKINKQGIHVIKID